MANTLTGLIPDLYAALDKVSRELTGYIPAVGTNLSGTAAAVNEAIRVPISTASTSSDISPSMTISEPTDKTVNHVDVKITKSKSVTFGITGEETRGLNNGSGVNEFQVKEIAQAMRTLVNEIEQDVADEARANASRAYGTAGTTPFATNLNDLNQLRKILVDNGAPTGDMQLVMDTTAGVNFGNLTQLSDVDRSGDTDFLRQGALGNKMVRGFTVRESGALSDVAAGGLTGDPTVTGINAIGSTTINVTCDADDTLTLVAGQTITFAGGDDKYVVVEDVTIGNSATGDVIIGGNGLRVATSANDAVAVGAAAEVGMAFDRESIQLVTRAPAMPAEGDGRADSMVITDPVSGLSFEISHWKGARKNKWEVALAWGVKGIKPEHAAQLLG
mgnify:FL=1